MKWNKKLWKKFVSKRVYGWDLIYKKDTYEEKKVYRNINGLSISEFRNDVGEQIEIPELPLNSANGQISSVLRKLSKTDAFMKCRELCNRKNYSMTIALRLKELR